MKGNKALERPCSASGPCLAAVEAPCGRSTQSFSHDFSDAAGYACGRL